MRIHAPIVPILSLAALFFLNAATAHSISASVDCNGTLAAWRADPNYRDYAASCTCPSSNEPPVCSGSGGGSSSGGLSQSNQINLMVTEMFLTALFNPAKPEPGAVPGPLNASLPPNPVYTKAWEELQKMRLPQEKANFLLAEALRSQQQSLLPYHPGDALQQLTLSHCLSLQATRADSMEEASWLLRQGSSALSGDLVEAAPSSCPPIPDPPTVQGPISRQTSLLNEFSAAVKLMDTKRAKWEEAKVDVRSARESVDRWEEISEKLSSETDAAATDEEKAEKKRAMEEALKMLAESKELFAGAEQFEENSEKDFMAAEQATRDAGDSLRSFSP